MPELPEVEIICRSIKASLENQVIVGCEVFNRKLRIMIPKNLAKILSQTQILNVKRRAKYILITLNNNFVLIIHLGMSGTLRVSNNYQAQKHDHVVIQLSNGTTLIYNDPRRFGLVTALASHELNNFSFLKRLGIEPLSKDFTASTLYSIIHSRTKAIKSVIMDASLIVGIGNIYASESLFLAGIKPNRSAKRISKKETTKLYESIVSTLQRAIKAGGSSISDFQHTDGSSGYFQHSFLVYDRKDQPCKQCQQAIQQIKQNGRSSYFCQICQK